MFQQLVLWFAFTGYRISNFNEIHECWFLNYILGSKHLYLSFCQLWSLGWLVGDVIQIGIHFSIEFGRSMVFVNLYSFFLLNLSIILVSDHVHNHFLLKMDLQPWNACNVHLGVIWFLKYAYSCNYIFFLHINKYYIYKMLVCSYLSSSNLTNIL